MSSTNQRTLGFWRCWSLVVGGAIGSAVSMMPAIMAPYGGLGLVPYAFSAASSLLLQRRQPSGTRGGRCREASIATTPISATTPVS